MLTSLMVAVLVGLISLVLIIAVVFAVVWAPRKAHDPMQEPNGDYPHLDAENWK